MSTGVAESAGFDDAASISDNDEQIKTKPDSESETSRTPVFKKPGKLVIIGQGAVGKTCFLLRVAHNQFPEEYVPTVFDSPDIPVLVRSQKHRMDVQIGLYDTSSRSDYERLRRLSYAGADLMVIAFSVIDQTSFENATTYYLTEAIEYAAGVPVVLLGLKTDLRTSTDIIEKLQKKGERIVSREDAEAVARKLGLKYFETSSLADPEGVQKVMQQCANIIADRHLPSDGSKKSGGGLLALVKRLFAKE